MEKITFEKFINLIKKYNDDEEDINQIKKAYDYAKDLHEGQFRQSGEHI